MSLTLDVEDTGSGIATHLLSRIFEPFEQGYKPGTGLGLPLSRELVQLMGSTLSVSQRAHGGSIFSFTIVRPVALYEPPQQLPTATPTGSDSGQEPNPVDVESTVAIRGGLNAAYGAHVAHITSNNASASSHSTPGTHGMDHTVHAASPVPVRGAAVEAAEPSLELRVLIADDLKSNRKVLAHKLRQVIRGLVLVEASTGEDALALLQEHTFDVVLLDQHFSNEPSRLTGTDVTQEWRAFEARRAAGPAAQMVDAPRVIIIGCSGNANTSDSEEGDFNEQALAAGQDMVWGEGQP